MQTYLLKHATLATLYPAKIEQADLRVAEGKIIEKGAELPRRDGDIEVDCSGKLMLPGMVCAHTHLYSALARGMPGPKEPPINFPQILEKVWWKLDRALDEEAIYYSAVAGILDAIACGTTTIIDHHASPGCISGSLKIMKEAFEMLGMRGVLCYEVTDRGGEAERDQGIEENRWLLEHQSELVKGLVGAHAAFTLSDESLKMCAGLVRAYQTGIHIHLAEDVCDVKTSLDQYDKSVASRLASFGLLNDKSLLAHGVHVSREELAWIRNIWCWLIHNPRSNMNNAVGYAPIDEFGDRAALGTDGISSNMFEEIKCMYFKAQDEKVPFGPEECIRFLNGGQRIASTLFGLPIGALEVGAAADLIVLDYPSPTPIHAGNLGGHLIFGMTHAHVDSVMIAGKFVLQNRHFTHPDATAFYQQAQQAAAKLWQRMS
ncbi:putative chlorohydrolase/aminohydrolase [Candidatus Moduliflexus flocculans]|uniref:Putative chlorohydrolase/aminohydrolase n=1 Tax=Candidatus Moduliflexus flocculans TaxID=1499966 RepID=A0A0S6VUB1_9BACT|nr:putative chlorohydrolase/aminohydrolase [Candidatus Moduliflexus flocculans]